MPDDHEPDPDTDVDPNHHLDSEPGNYWNVLLVAAIIIVMIDAAFLLFGFLLDEQFLIALGTCTFSLAVFLFVFYLRSLNENPELIRKVISVSAWIMILQILLLAIGPPWSKSGTIFSFFAIALFGAAVVNGWGTDVEWVKKYAIRFAVFLFVLCTIFVLFGSSLSFKSMGKAWKNFQASHGQSVASRRLKDNSTAQKQQPIIAPNQPNELKTIVKETDQPARVKPVAPSRKAVFDEDYWRVKQELETWRAQVDSL